MAISVLIADDDPNTRYLLEIFCRDREGLRLEFVSNGQEALGRIGEGSVDILVTDIRMPVMSGDELLTAIRKQFPQIPVLIMTSYGSIEDAVDFLHRGAEDYLAKPLTKEVFLHRLDRVMERVALAQEVRKLRDSVAQAEGAQLIGRSRPMLELAAKIPTIAQTEASIVILGESGSGKEVVARSIHAQSRRSDRPFVTVNCGSLPDTLLESELFGYRRGAFTDAREDTPGLVDTANRGTLFMDEIGEISPAVQVKLLRFLQLKEYKPLGSPKSKIADVRIIAATNRDLKREVAKGGFREDLYYRLNIIPLEIPRLRDRTGDIALLATHFLERFNRRFNREVVIRSPEVFRKLETYPWPGNVRELENKIEQLVVLAVDGTIRPEDIRFNEESGGSELGGSLGWSPNGTIGSYKEEKRAVLDRFERTYLSALLTDENGHLSKVADRAGLDRKNLWQLLKRHHLKAETFRTAES
ncbi:MAG: sigma-54-dependent Fis family transcriptional regulator [Deltaproteobacteria bacterium]|nr:sigma-54-dependent Fis family transcriptional regulator [Deltaproteobacteria bacterium]